MGHRRASPDRASWQNEAARGFQPSVEIDGGDQAFHHVGADIQHPLRR
jgi:hypothetical protein